MATEDSEDTSKLRLRHKVTSENENSDDKLHLLRVLNATQDSGDAPNAQTRDLGVPLVLHFNKVECRKTMVNVEICFQTEDYPQENIVWIEDEDGEIGFEMGPFSKDNKMYCEEEEFCPGKYWLGIDDSYGDGTNSDYGEIIVRTRNKKLLDKTLYDFGSLYGPRKFVVPEEDDGSSNNNNNNNNNGGNGPYGCCSSSSGTHCCRCCKDECARRYKHLGTAAKNDCKRNVCRSFYGRPACKD